jgi:hypothetical protein
MGSESRSMSHCTVSPVDQCEPHNVGRYLSPLIHEKKGISGNRTGYEHVLSGVLEQPLYFVYQLSLERWETISSVVTVRARAHLDPIPEACESERWWPFVPVCLPALAGLGLRWKSRKDFLLKY